MVKKKAPKEKTYVAVVLDRSGSMDSIRQEALDVFNEQVKTIQAKAKDMDVSVCFSTFSTAADKPVIWMQDAQELKPMTTAQYMPAGMTAMYDGVGDAIDGLKKAADADEKHVAFLVVIISDGFENNSKRFSAADIAERVQACEKTGRWTFTYLGANQDLKKVSKDLGINLGNMAAFVSTAEGTRDATTMHAAATSGYMVNRSKGIKADTSFYARAGGAPDKNVKA
jgi:hypothetical protein